MRLVLLLSTILPFNVLACTTFKVTQDGRTLIGCNEDAWSINAHVRFEQGVVTPGLTRSRTYGAIYFGHFNGSPMRAMTDQMGMNEAGLVYDGLVVEPKNVVPKSGLKRGDFSDLMPMVMRSCATVQDAAALIGSYDMSSLYHSMIVLVDRNGDYLIVESDTIIKGHDPWFAVGNWRMSSCGDPDAIPIPRLQVGRALLAVGIDATVDGGTHVLESMKSCRTKLGNGTLFSALFDPVLGQAHLFFYHDFRERITFDLKAELAKGDRTIDMASLFGKRPEYDALVAYITPFHQRWLFWLLVAFEVVALLTGAMVLAALSLRLIARVRGRSSGDGALPLFATLLSSAMLAFLIPVLLLNEGVYYFGLGDAVDSILPALEYLPILLCLLTGALLAQAFRRWRSDTHAPVARMAITAFTACQCALVATLFYWDMVLP